MVFTKQFGLMRLKCVVRYFNRNIEEPAPPNGCEGAGKIIGFGPRVADEYLLIQFAGIRVFPNRVIEVAVYDRCDWNEFCVVLENLKFSASEMP